jgi:hypothetical protein
VLNVTPSGVLANDVDGRRRVEVSAVEGNAADVGNTITLASGRCSGSTPTAPSSDRTGSIWPPETSIRQLITSHLAGGFDFATVTITLTGVNDAPAGVDST